MHGDEVGTTVEGLDGEQFRTLPRNGWLERRCADGGFFKTQSIEANLLLCILIELRKANATAAMSDEAGKLQEAVLTCAQAGRAEIDGFGYGRRNETH
jgi:hypothetical protein